MNWLFVFSNPIILLFVTIVLGCLISKIKLFNISLDLSAILIVAVLFGYLIINYMPNIVNSDFENNMTLLSKLGTALFVSSIGLLSGNSIGNGFSKQKLQGFVIGSLMVLITIIFMNIIRLSDPNINPVLLIGILCGALTSTPGLSTVCESEIALSEFAVMGYGCAYIFGVIGVVLFVQIKARNIKNEVKPQNNNSDSKFNINDIILLGSSVILGTIFGNMSLPMLNFSLGTSGGILVVAILIGFLRNKFGKSSNIESVGVYRNLGLMIFFVGTGIPAGIRFTYAFSIKFLIYGIILTIIPILFGYIISHYILNFNLNDSLSIIAGGMTSTPAIGVLIRNPNMSPNLSAYSFAYLGALLTIVICL